MATGEGATHHEEGEKERETEGKNEMLQKDTSHYREPPSIITGAYIQTEEVIDESSRVRLHFHLCPFVLGLLKGAYILIFLYFPLHPDQLILIVRPEFCPLYQHPGVTRGPADDFNV